MDGAGGTVGVDTVIAVVMDIAAGTDTAADMLEAIAAVTQADTAAAMRLGAELHREDSAVAEPVADTQAAAVVSTAAVEAASMAEAADTGKA